MPKTKIKEYIFTFGAEHKYPNCFVVIKAASLNEARNEMFDRFGTQWAFQYNSREEAQVKKYKYKEVFI